MEQIDQVVQQVKNLPNLLQENLESISEISLYKGQLSARCLVESIATIQKAFPALPIGFFDVFTDRLADNGFCDERLKDAIKNVIDTCIYPTPTIAQFISWDKKIKVFKYPEIVKMVEDGDPNAFDRYKRIEIEGLPEAVWVHINDIVKYKIKSKQP
jgi:hypothetical protein